MGQHGKQRRTFFAYPIPREAPNVPYKNDRKRSPVLTGPVLSVAAFFIERIWFVAKLVWLNAGFGNLRKIRYVLETYESRFDPTVVPIEDPFGDDHADDSADAEEIEVSASAIEESPSKYYSVADYHTLYKSGDITPTAVVNAILPLIRRDIDPPGEHSIAWFNCQADLILAAAEASTKRYQEGKPLSIFDGVPTGVKDEYDLDGYTSCLGSLNDYTGDVMADGSITSWCPRQLEKAGAIVLGKTSMHEFGLDTTGNNVFYGTPTNPHNPHYYTGGSSSGSAYNVSTGIIPIALGSDGGGSVRIPSSMCSVFGLKPSHNRLSHHPSLNHANTVAVNGVMATDIRTLAAAYEVVAAADSLSEFSSPLRTNFLSTPERTKVLGFPKVWFEQASPRVQALCQSMLDKMVSVHGYKIVPIEIPFLAEGQAAHAITILADASALLPDTSKFSAANRILLALGRSTPATDYVLAQKLRNVLMQHLAFLWKQYPGMVIVTPTTGCAGWHIKSKRELTWGLNDGNQTLRAMEYVWLANFTGNPSITVPAGFAQGVRDPNDRVPVGLMALGDWGAEDELLRWGLDAEDVGKSLHCRPPVWVDVVARAREEMKKTAVQN